MIGLSGFGFRRKPRNFEYKPRHFDPDAEQREARRRAILGDEYAKGEYRPGMLIREGRMMRMESRDRDTNQRKKRTLIRTAVFVVLVVAVLYVMLTYMEQFSQQAPL